MDAADTQRYAIETPDGITVVRFLTPRLNNVSELEGLRNDLMQRIEAGEPKVVLDFSGVEFVSSGMLGVLAALNSHIQARHGQLRVAALTPAVNETFHLVALHKVIPAHVTRAEAIAAMK